MNFEALIDRYCDVWTHPDPAQRAALLDAVWAPGATYTDPSVHAAGAAELLAHIARVHACWPGATITRTSAVDGHHGAARFAWHAVDAAGNELVRGIDVAFVSSDGTRVERILGFFGDLQPMAAR